MRLNLHQFTILSLLLLFASCGKQAQFQGGSPEDIINRNPLTTTIKTFQLSNLDNEILIKFDSNAEVITPHEIAVTEGDGTGSTFNLHLNGDINGIYETYCTYIGSQKKFFIHDCYNQDGQSIGTAPGNLELQAKGKYMYLELNASTERNLSIQMQLEVRD